MKTTMKAVLASLALAALAACGGGGGTSTGATDNPSIVRTGVFVDGLVEGVAYKTSSGLSGTTGPSGQYQFRNGDKVSFYVGNVKLGEFTASEMVSILNSPNAAEVAMFLQALDTDGNAANGIQISQTMATRFENATLKIEAVVPGDPMFESTFEIFAGRKFEVNAQDALEHARQASMQALIGDTVLWQYYAGDMTWDARSYKVDALNAKARNRLYLYVYQHQVAPMFESKRYLLHDGNAAVQRINERNKNVASDMAAVAGAVVSVTESILEGKGPLQAAFKQRKEDIESQLHQHALNEIQGRTDQVNNQFVRFAGGFLHRFASSVWDCREAMSNVTGCAISLSNQTFDTFSNGFTVLTLRDSLQQIDTLMAAERYLDSYFRHAGDLARVSREFDLPESSTYLAVVAAVAKSSLNPRADLDAVHNLISIYQQEVGDQAYDLVKVLGLNDLAAKGQVLAPGAVQVSFVPSSTQVANGKLRVCFDMRNNLLTSATQLNVSIKDDSYALNGGLLYAGTHDLAARASGKSCVSLNRSLDLSYGDAIPLRIEAVEQASQQTLSDGMVVALSQIQQADDALRSLSVPDFAVEVQPTGQNIPSENLVYGVNLVKLAMDADSQQTMDAWVPNATYSWSEVRFSGVSDLSFYGGITSQKQALIKFPALKKDETRAYFVQLKVSNPVSKLSKTYIVRVNLSNQSARVDAIAPRSARPGVATLFTIKGQAFPLNMTAQIQGADCPAAQKRRISSSEFQLTCQHPVEAKLSMTAVTQTGGSLLPGGSTDIAFAQATSATAPTITKIALFADATPPVLFVQFDRDMQSGFHTTGEYVPSYSRWLSKRMFAMDFTSYNPNGTIVLRSGGFVSVAGESMASDWKFNFDRSGYGPVGDEHELFAGSLSGRVTFLDSTGAEKAAPGDAWVRITPASLVSQNVYLSVYCQVRADGRWGSEVEGGPFACLTDDGSRFASALADGSEAYQVVVYRQHVGDFYWNCREDSYRYVGGQVPRLGWSNMTVRPEDYQNRSSETCGG